MSSISFTIDLEAIVFRIHHYSWALVVVLGIPTFVSAVEPKLKPMTIEPVVAPASDDAAKQIASFKKPENWTCQVFAAEPDVANPVVFTLDSQGRVYVCESFRQNQGVTDNRHHDKQWLLADLAANTVADRIAYHRRLLKEEAISYEKQVDRIRVLTDHDRDGRADESKVLVSGFNGIEEGTGAGILVRDDQIYFTCIPKLWSLQDKNFDGVADEQKLLADGFGVRVAFRGHDLHGLIKGPDGRIYFSIGDRGYHVVTPNGVLSDPECGAIFRCEPDGSQLEVVATGLRNPQELAFDDYGTFFTCDNNSDSGDEARWTVIAFGGDSGWRMMYQYLPDRGPFNRENIWHPLNPKSPAYIIPPIANFADGPSGLTYYPGTGLDDSYRHTFFLCDFRGQASNSGIRTVKLAPQGAFFKLSEDGQPIWNMLATDIEFGSDGSLYVSDWVNGWNGEGKGRIYRFFDEQAIQTSASLETYAILNRGLKQVNDRQLGRWLSHADRRVRLEAQWELASRGGHATLDEISADSNTSELGRIHALWGLGQIARLSNHSEDAVESLTKSLIRGGGETNQPVEILVASINAISELSQALSSIPKARELVETHIVNLLRHNEPRVRYAAGMAAWRMKSEASFQNVIAMLEKNRDQDPMIRHAGIMALSGIPDLNSVATLATHSSESVRVAAVVAFRKNASPLISRFLDDSSERVVLEAARAIHDVPALHSELPALASRLSRAPQHDAILRRILNAHFRLGKDANGTALAEFAANSKRPSAMRIEALKMLQTWSTPGQLDRVMNRYAPLEPRATTIVADALRDVLPKLATGDNDVRKLTRTVAAELGLKEVMPELIKVIEDVNAPGVERASAFESLIRLDFSESMLMTKLLVNDPSPVVRVTATKILAKLDPEAALKAANKGIHSTVVLERQAAWDVIGTLRLPTADALLRDGMKSYLNGNLPQDVWLNVKEASQDRLDPSLQKQAELHELSLFAKSETDPILAYGDCLTGGDQVQGRVLFFERTQLSCLRCHEIGDDGGDVGPKLTDIGIKKSREYLLEALVAPNAKLAEGFETIIVQTEDGEVVAGILKTQDEKRLTIQKTDGNMAIIDRSMIEGTKKGQSSMPVDLLKYLNRRELRNLVAYLASLNGSEVKEKNAEKPATKPK